MAQKIIRRTKRATCLCGSRAVPLVRKVRFIPSHDARYHAARKHAARIVVLKVDGLTTSDGEGGGSLLSGS